MRNGIKKPPCSDFYFEIISKVIACQPSSTGFLIKVFPDQTNSEDPVRYSSFHPSTALQYSDIEVLCVLKH